MSAVRGIVGRRLVLPPDQASYIRRAFALRKRLTNRALAERFQISMNTVNQYGGGRLKKLGRGEYK